ncbi:unnamed protein product [Cuscuta europaea]|uniref:Uncharacterized protein n=1 Tax=Cuscuta europaea TaxID=41803 RepID=A0A9P0YGY0_CUSEU|nr:unnamed protein product [Cuscuta europaea]
MELQCPRSLLPNRLSFPNFSPFRHQISNLTSRKQALLRPELKLNSWLKNGAIVPMSRSSSSSKQKLRSSGSGDSNVLDNGISRVKPHQGKPGSVSFVGLTHQLVEENKSELAPSEREIGSFRWVIAPLALISSFVFPRFLVDIAIDGLQNDVLSEILTSSITEVIFYIGVGVYLSVTGHVQKPYLEFSTKRWSLITGHRGYSTSAVLIMGFKTLLPLFVLYITWPALDTIALVAMAPLLLGFLVQFAFEKQLQKNKSSCWPLVPIIFEVYRFYQLTRAIGFVQRVMFATRKLPMTPDTLQRNGAFVSLIVTFQALGLACLWSLLSFLVTLFPSSPVDENY